MKTDLVVQRALQHAGIPPDSDFQAWAAAALAGHDGNASLTIRIVGPDESRRLNHAYRGKDSATNVLSFCADLPDGVVDALQGGGEAPPLGDLVICAEVVAREAADQGKPPGHHWAHLVIHGILHLLGHDHADAGEAREMEDLERQLLAGLGIPDPYRAR